MMDNSKTAITRFVTAVYAAPLFRRKSGSNSRHDPWDITQVALSKNPPTAILAPRSEAVGWSDPCFKLEISFKKNPSTVFSGTTFIGGCGPAAGSVGLFGGFLFASQKKKKRPKMGRLYFVRIS